jgi:uncharacterized protein (TIGR02271 family)
MNIPPHSDLKGISVLRDDGISGVIVDNEELGRLVIEFDDGTRLVVPHDVLTPQPDGTYYLFLGTPDSSPSPDGAGTEEMVIPVIAEELTIEKEKIVRGSVKVHKRIETREEIVDAPVTHEEVVVERVTVNRLIDDAVPDVRDEDGVLIIPLIEEVLVVEKRFLLREEVRVSKHRKTENSPQTVTLRREVVDIERTDNDGTN